MLRCSKGLFCRRPRFREENFAEMCKILFDDVPGRNIFHVPHHCGFGITEVFFPSRLTREPIRSDFRFRAGVVREARGSEEQLIFESLVPRFR